MAGNGTDSNKITPQQQRAISALLSTNSVADAARRANVPERTLFRWLGDATFKAALSQAEGELIDAATRKLLRYQDAASTTILTIMADRNFPAGVRLRAAMAIIDTMLKLREMRDIETRLAALEASIANQGN